MYSVCNNHLLQLFKEKEGRTGHLKTVQELLRAGALTNTQDQACTCRLVMCDCVHTAMLRLDGPRGGRCPGSGNQSEEPEDEGAGVIMAPEGKGAL